MLLVIGHVVLYECAELLPIMKLCTKINAQLTWCNEIEIIIKKNPTPRSKSRSECRTIEIDFSSRYLFVLFHYDCRGSDITFPIRCMYLVDKYFLLFECSFVMQQIVLIIACWLLVSVLCSFIINDILFSSRTDSNWAVPNHFFVIMINDSNN